MLAWLLYLKGLLEKSIENGKNQDDESFLKLIEELERLINEIKYTR